MSFRDFRDLKAWQRAMELAEAVYAATDTLPSDERYGLRSQMRRAVVSVPSNIAEGHCRWSDASFSQFLGYSLGSLGELATQVELCRRLGFWSQVQSEQISERISACRRTLLPLRRSVDRAATRP